MSNNPRNPIRLDEGRVQRGASGQGPRTPKPDITPKGQGTTMTEKLPPKIGHIFKLSEIIHEVDSSYSHGASERLALAILSHPSVEEIKFISEKQ